MSYSGLFRESQKGHWANSRWAPHSFPDSWLSLLKGPWRLLQPSRAYVSKEYKGTTTVVYQQPDLANPTSLFLTPNWSSSCYVFLPITPLDLTRVWIGCFFLISNEFPPIFCLIVHLSKMSLAALARSNQKQVLSILTSIPSPQPSTILMQLWITHSLSWVACFLFLSL